MIIATTRYAIDRAMESTRAQFNGNIENRSIESTRTKPVRDSDRNRFAVTITVRETKGMGGSRNPNTDRRIHAACWHVHGVLFDQLLRFDPAAIIRTHAGTFDIHGGNWRDYDRGSVYYPSRASDWCDCSGRFSFETGRWMAA